MGIGNTRLDRDNENLKEILKVNVEKPIKLMVFSSKTITCREVMLTPSTLWGGQGLLGVSIRFCTFENAHENVWHILEVENSSPAHFAGLRSFTDYIIGADSISLAEQDDLFSLVEAHDGRPLKLFVYNSETDSCRDVVVTPNSAWGGDGLLGCGIGYGLLHRIPTDGRDHTTLGDKIRYQRQLDEATQKEREENKSRSNRASNVSLTHIPPPVAPMPVTGTTTSVLQTSNTNFNHILDQSQSVIGLPTPLNQPLNSNLANLQ